MGNQIFESPWTDDAEYIINLTKHVVGERTLSALSSPGSGARNSRALVLVLTPRVVIAVMRMTCETLGKISAYGTERGFHDGLPVAASFLNLTGYKDLIVDRSDIFDKGSSGRDVLEQLAIFTILCVARDIIMQPEWQIQVAEALQANDACERGMEDYIHGRKR